jgi:hypothetical protein
MFTVCCALSLLLAFLGKTAFTALMSACAVGIGIWMSMPLGYAKAHNMVFIKLALCMAFSCHVEDRHEQTN